MSLPLLSLLLATAAPTSLEDALKAYDRRDWFALREAVATLDSGGEARFLRGVSLNRFNRWGDSDRELTRYLEQDRIPRDKVVEAWQTRADNALKQGRYRRAAECYGEALAAMDPKDQSERASTKTVQDLCFALRDVPPSSVSRSAKVVLQTTVASGGRRLPVTIGGNTRNFLVDSGADFSLVTAGLAKQLGMRIIPTDIQVGTITEAKVTMNLATLPEIGIGSLRLRNPIFLVLDESASSIPMESLGISGIVGLPVLLALGEVTFGRDGTVTIDPAGTLSNGALCLEGLKPMIRAEVGERVLPFLLDTGASRTDLYPPFFSAFRDEIRERGTRVNHTVTGVGGSSTVLAWSLPQVNFGLPGGAQVSLPNQRIFARQLRSSEAYSFGNLGQDLLDRCRSFTINVRRCGIEFAGTETRR